MDESLRLLHVLRAWYWTGSGVFDPARCDPLYPQNAMDHRERARIWAAVPDLLDGKPYVRPSSAEGEQK